MNDPGQHTIKKLDMLIHLDEVDGQQHTYRSIRPNSRILNPTSAVVKSKILNKIQQLIAGSRIVHGLPDKQELNKQIRIYLEGYQNQEEVPEFTLTAKKITVNS